jgi:hypothetical protein
MAEREDILVPEGTSLTLQPLLWPPSYPTMVEQKFCAH